MTNSELDAAIASLTGDSAQAPALAKLLNQRGCIRFRAGALDAALEDFDAALDLWDECALAYNNRACLRAERGDLVRARIDFARALSLEPTLQDAVENHGLLARVSAPPVDGIRGTTVSTVDGTTQASFFETLTQFLEATVHANPGFEDTREDAIAEVVTRVLTHSQKSDLPLADALREVRRSSTRGWVKTLMRRLGKRGGEPVPESVQAPAQPEDAPALRLDSLFAEIQERLLAASRPSKRLRRRIVWGVYLRGLLDGVLLSRREVIAAARSLGLKAPKVTDKQIERDVEILVKELRASRPEPGDQARGMGAK